MKSIGTIIFSVLGGLCLLYCLCIALFMGYGSHFFMIWGVMAVGFGMLAFLFAKPNRMSKIPGGIKRLFIICATLSVIAFVFVEGLILSQFNAKATDDADYMIVLGAQWKQNGPSYVLQKRLEKAIMYLENNPDTIVIVSGGQGGNEPITEAEGMKSYLMQNGIVEERILMENRSTSTYENLVFSWELLDPEKDSVVLVTNNFHVYRAVQIAEKQGYEHIEGLAASSYPGMVPNNLLREFFGVLKDFLVGNM